MKLILLSIVVLFSVSSFADEMAFCTIDQNNSIKAEYTTQTKQMLVTWNIKGQTKVSPGVEYLLLNKQQTQQDPDLTYIAQNIGVDIKTVDFTQIFVLAKNNDGSANLIKFIQQATKKTTLAFVVMSGIIKCK